LDLKNTSNTDDRQEVAQMIGPGLGLELRFTRFLAGIDYNHIMARHIGVGPISGTLEYEMRVLNYYAGIAWQFGALSLSLSYSMASGEVPTSATGFEKASAYSDKIIWINFRYATGESLSNIGKSIVKN
ncbi:MAG: hypothetical protein KDD43_15225, partial [Bdellovibrionales bacterium]|nr:hypothetical protein [Bdellovibrionales bacterium]